MIDHINIFFITSKFLHLEIKVIAKLLNSEQSSKGKVMCINRQNQSTTGKLGNP